MEFVLLVMLLVLFVVEVELPDGAMGAVWLSSSPPSAFMSPP